MVGLGKKEKKAKAAEVGKAEACLAWRKDEVATAEEVRALRLSLADRAKELNQAAETLQLALLLKDFGPSKNPKEAAAEVKRFLDGVWFDPAAVPDRRSMDDEEWEGIAVYGAECAAALWADEFLRELCGIGVNEARVVGLHKERPWLSQREIAEAVGASEKRVSRTVADLHLAWRKEPRPKDVAMTADAAKEGGVHDGEGR